MNENSVKFLKIFFDFKYERSMEREMLNDLSLEQKNEVYDYILQLINIEVSDFVEYIKLFYSRQPIIAADVFQFSDFDNATVNLCRIIAQTKNQGMKFKEIGKLLLNDDVVRNDSALNKYGENHIKMATSLGLAFKDNSNFYYLSAVGYVLSELSYDQQEKLLTRLIIRNKLISQLFVVALQGDVDLETFLYDLSESTYKRRRTNINYVLEFLNNSQEYNFKHITQNIKY